MRFLPTDAIVLVDIDGPQLPSIDWMMYRLRRAGYQTVRWMSVTRSPGGTGWHLRLEVVPAPASAVEVVAVQLLLGSDPAREAATLQRARMWKDTPPFARSWWNVLYNRTPARSRRLRVADLPGAVKEA